jgi:predicted ATPase
VSAIVIKLLSKNAEERYQSAYGLEADLQKCLHKFTKYRSIENFTLGQSDIVEWLQIPQKLYGRENETELLLSAFSRVANGNPEMLLISGFSGIGKTVLVNDLQKHILEKRGYFISGKFDQFNRNVPYASLIQAFRDLIRQLLSENEEQIIYWKQQLLLALGINAQVVIEVIPELEFLIGQQPPVLPLGTTESQNRLNTSFQSFVRVFTQKEHPLVLFLDDLQWVDQGSLQMINLLMSDKSCRHFLLIGSYRDNEVTASHPLLRLIDEIKRNRVSITNILLSPLTNNDIVKLIIETFNCSSSIASPLAELVQKKTNGNPFFINQFIKTLYSEKAIEYDEKQGKWVWDISVIRDMRITDNVIELMTGKIRKMQGDVQETLQLAACLGNKFSLEALSQIREIPITQTARDLVPAMEEGLILPIGNNYKLLETITESDNLNNAEILGITYRFVHDRVQQAAYFLINEEQKKEVHLKIGRLLLANSNNTYQENIFDIVNHLNFSLDLILDPGEKLKVADLNLQAGKKAKASSAFPEALKYLRLGSSLLNTECWHSDYSLCYSMHMELAECEHLCGNVQQAEEYFDVVINRSRSGMDKAMVYEKKVHFYSNLSRFRIHMKQQDKL